MISITAPFPCIKCTQANSRTVDPGCTKLFWELQHLLRWVNDTFGKRPVVFPAHVMSILLLSTSSRPSLTLPLLWKQIPPTALCSLVIQTFIQSNYRHLFLNCLLIIIRFYPFFTHLFTFFECHHWVQCF